MRYGAGVNYHSTFDLTGLLLAFAFGGVWWVVTAGATSIGKQWLADSQRAELRALANALDLDVDGDVLRGARGGVLVVVEWDGNKEGTMLWRVSLLDPRGTAGLDFARDGFAAPASGPDVVLGDEAFDDVVHVAAGDPAVALAGLPPSAREAVREGVRQGWERNGATWRKCGLGSSAELIDIAIKQGVRLCGAVRTDGTGVRHRLKLRCSDPVHGVATRAMRLRLDRGWLDDEELESLLHHRDPEVAVRGATLRKDADWLQEKALRGTGLEIRLRATLALYALGADDRLPMAVEALLLRGLHGPLHEECLVMLASVGGSKALESLAGLPEAEAARASIEARRAELRGGVALVNRDVGQLSVADAE